MDSYEISLVGFCFNLLEKFMFLGCRYGLMMPSPTTILKQLFDTLCFVSIHPTLKCTLWSASNL
ncbi:hypothetical protein FC43_GL001566 [Limosilactobacillus ingluviei DSM 15946]|uniref:Uncharacterized protein n=1 Tax=Limosilactobacillus ingluviei DSM 15946 TaxID=1423760 RepID=A0A0R1U8T5_9LACO|nr:hypothetical protein FC43_GL001566 [Limosilactobacillus ingluviei DSM 15946]